MEKDWFRDGQPSSYKIQLSYVEIPKHLKLQERTVDTPFRFESFEEAQNAADDLFKGYSYKVIGSNDEVHWQAAPVGKKLSNDVTDDSWYNIYGVKPTYQTKVETAAIKQLNKLQYKRKAVQNQQQKPPRKQKQKQQPQQTKQQKQ